MTDRPLSGAPDRKLKRTLILMLVVGLAAASIFLALGGPTGLALRPGIFGTRANLWSDINLIAQFVLLTGLGVGYFLARSGNITAHQYNQTTWVFFNLVLTVFIMIVAYYENVVPGLPGNLRQAHALVSTIHGLLGLTAIFCGLYLILRMNKWIPERWRIKWWKRLMRITLGLYWLVGLLGLALYYVWFIR